MKCMIEGCQYISSDLTDHIKRFHKMSVIQYKFITKVKIVKDNEIFCDICGKTYDTQDEFNRHCLKASDIKHSHLIYTNENKDDWVECKVDNCGFRATKISEHIKLKHNLEKEKYKEMYKIDYLSKHYLEKIRETSKKGSSSKRHYYNKCEICGTDLYSQKTVCDDCREKQLRQQQEDKFKDKIENTDFVRCKCKLKDGTICNWPSQKINRHIKDVHGYDRIRYEEEFKSPVYSKILLKDEENG